MGRESGRSTRREGGRERERERPHYPILPLQKMTFLSRSRLPLGRLRSTHLSLVPFTRRCLVAHTSPVEGDGNGNNTPWWNYLHFVPVSALVVALGLGWTFFRDGIYLNVQKVQKVNVQQVMKAIKVSKLRMPQVAGYIKRNQEMKAFSFMILKLSL